MSEKAGFPTVVDPNAKAVAIAKPRTSPRGLENADQDDFVVPRIQLAQAMSPELKPSDPMFIPKLAQGQMFNTVTREIYGAEIEVIPIMFSKSRAYFRDRGEGGGIKCSSANGLNGGVLSATCEECEFSKWGSRKKDANDNGIACTEFKNYPCLVITKDGRVDLASVSMKSSAIKVAKRWNSFMRTRRRPDGQAADVFESIYIIKAVTEKNAKGEFFNFTVNLGSGLKQDDKRYQEAAVLYDAFSARGIKVDLTGEEGAEATDGSHEY